MISKFNIFSGKLQKPSRYELEVPYKGRALRGDELVQQLNKWAKYGTIEPSAAEAISAVINHVVFKLTFKGRQKL
jgi:hypothetical protein